MKLNDWLDRHWKESKAEFARQCDITPQRLNEILNGGIPREDAMAGIIRVTGKKVMPNDFYA